ncbi:MAG TPA: FG-GAP-like repeat-containing protein [Thermoanaerobaculia bacterium]|nr:FG-GAP-like repeat-containing protein [Thermoanaerobaculia bacterium]
MPPFLRIAAALLVFALPAAAAVPVFRNPQPLPVTGHGGTLLRGSFGGDAQPDLAVYDGFTVQILISNGISPFIRAAGTVAIEGAVDLVAGDVTGDGRSDLVASFFDPGAVRIYRGLGNGLFDAGTAIPSMPMPGKLAIADFNGDGRADLLVATADPHPEDPIMTVHLGEGNGAFGSGIASPVYDTPNHLQVLDANGDTKPDLVVSSSGTWVHLGSGDGSFISHGRVLIDRAATASGDFNGDGHADLVLAPGDLGSGSIQIALGDGTGTFTQGARYAVGGGARELAVADVDGDGKADLLVPSIEGTLTIRRGAGNGTFASVRFYATGRLVSFQPGDWDRDGLTDVVVSGTDRWPGVRLIKGKNGGLFDTWRAYMPPATVPIYGLSANVQSGVVADMNGDGKPDVIGLTERHDNYAMQLVIMLNGGFATLGPPIFTELGESEWNLGPYFCTGDVNGDGKPDAVVVSLHPNGVPVRTYLGRGDGSFDPPIDLAIGPGRDPRLAELDGDGVLDLLLGTNVFHGNGNGTFTPATTLPVQVQAVADFNGDGHLDVAGEGFSGIYVGLNDGSGGFTTVSTEEWATRYFGTVGDFTGDGKTDVLLVTYTGTRVRPGNGDGKFGDAIDFEITPRIEYRVHTADFDGDGKLDLLNGTEVYLGDGEGRFRSYAYAVAPPLPEVGVGDFDGNGSPDVAAFLGTTVSIYLTRLGLAPALSASVEVSSDTPQGHYALGITYTAAVEGLATLPLTGAVVFSDDGVPVSMRVLGETAVSERILSPAAGTRTIRAAYSGDERYKPASDSLQQSIAKAATTLTAVSLKTPEHYPKEARVSVTLSALVDNYYLMPPRQFTFRLSGKVLQSRIDPNREDAFYVAGLPIGTHSVTVEYAGNGNFEPSTTTFAQVIRNTDPGLVISIDPSSNVVAGTPVTLRGTVLPGVAGSVSFLANDELLGSAPIVDGAAQLTRTFAWGDYAVVAYYPGSPQYADDSGTMPLTVHAGAWGTRPQVQATADGMAVTIRWSPVIGASSFTIYRRGAFTQAWESLGMYGAYGGYFLPVEIPANSTWQFAATAHDANGNSSAMSLPDLATSVALPAPITPGVTRLRAADFLQLRAAVNSVRAFAGLAPASFTDPVLTGQRIRAIHVMDLRTALSQARSAIAMPLGFSDPALTARVTPVRALHVQQIREGVE